MGAAVLPPISSHDELFPVHVAQHLLLGMAGPAFLALSAPVTLALRTLPQGPRRMLLRMLHSRPAVVLSAPATAVILDIGGLYALYLTGLYSAAERNELIHAAVHLHMFLAGCLLSWAIIGVDPIRRRPASRQARRADRRRRRHDTLAKLMYAHNLPWRRIHHGRHAGAELMYYGGTVVGLALAIIVMTQWYQLTGRELARTAAGQMTRPGMEFQPRIWSTVLRCEGSPCNMTLLPSCCARSPLLPAGPIRAREGTVALVERGWPETGRGDCTSHRIGLRRLPVPAGGDLARCPVAPAVWAVLPGR